ncbi:sodium-coupled monocarboxylate transporter 1-like [Copidosoma floridanum]|uniref:sodium-coupled monocarboxylate transporter 1-like n=1 Tax=Copidosoma floridanum TaxID=29053 RepID=UPI0006C9B70A|nr:sodium-coupled monocarboxylate transporter 1-like [Copidosoma floridanum]
MDTTMSTSLPTFGNSMLQLTFGWTDYLLFSGLLGISLLVGFYFGFFSKQDSASKYLFGGKHMSYIPVFTSILASMLSGITFLGIPTEVYFHGAQFIVTLIPNFLCCLIIAHVIIPLFYDLKLSSSYEYLQLRFSRSIRMLASTLYIVSLLLYIPVVMYVPALAFSQVTGYGIHTITPVFSIVCITYTTMGGVKAVIWTDTIQFFFTIGSLFTVLIIGIYGLGGFSNIYNIVNEGGRLDIFDSNMSPFGRNTFMGLTFGMLFGHLSRIGIGQKFIQRFLSIEKKADIKKAVYLMMFGWQVLLTSCILTGLIVYAKYHSCDPLSAKLVHRNDQTLPYYVMDVARNIHGLPGIFLAGLVSSALSTMSASLNSLSGIIYENFVDRWIPETSKKDATAACIMKWISVLIGAITIALIFVIEHLGTIFEIANSLSTIVDGPLLGLFVAGMFFPWVGTKGAIIGGSVGLTIMAWIVGGTQWHIINKRIHHSVLPTSTEGCPYPLNETVTSVTSKPLAPEDEPWLIFRLSFLYLIFVGMTITVIISLIASWVAGETDLQKIDPRHVVPFVKRFLPKKNYVTVPLKDIIPEKVML